MEFIDVETANAEKLMSKYGIGSLLAKVLCSFNYDEEQLSSFFASDPPITVNESCFAQTKELLEQIKTENRKVFIFGDYDCDGICATTILCQILDKMQIQRGFYIPNRVHEGYGLNVEKLQLAYEKGYDVLFTVDNGISAQEGLKWAKDHHMTVIVSDHHRRDGEVQCDLLLHPDVMNEDKKYLCGTTVVYMLARYLNLADEKMSVLAALATISDVMELRGINITIIKEGLKNLSNGKYPAITSMDDFYQPMNEEDVSFKIVPKINAVGRMEDYSNDTPLKAYDVVRYLLGEKDIRAYLNQTNDLRKEITAAILKRLQSQIDLQHKIMVFYDKDAPVGLIGAIASRLSSQYNRIVFVLCENEGIIKGSGRSIDNVDIMELLNDFKDKMPALGGHRGACGLSLKTNDLELFRNYLYDKEAALPDAEPVHCICLDENDLTIANMKELYDHRPFGQGRRLPSVHVRLTHYDSYMPLRNNHQLKWVLNGINFLSFDNEGYDCYLNKNVELFGELSEDNYRGRISYTIHVKKIN